jgi:hypothetical protein
MYSRSRKILEEVTKQIDEVTFEDEYGYPDISWRVLEDWSDLISTAIALDENETD